MRLVFVHGMRQEGLDPVALRTTWETALVGAWNRLGLPPRQYELEMPYYGDLLENLTQEARGGKSNIVSRGPAGAAAFTPLEEQMIRAMATRAGVTNADVDAELGQEIVARGPLNWEWVMALGRALDKKLPTLGEWVLRYVAQVDSYLTRPHIHAAINDLVGPAFNKGPTVIVSHSLGTIVSYDLLRNSASAPNVPLFVTLGSPLGIDTVINNLRPPSLAIPAGAARWFNGADPRDYVALVRPLDGTNFVDGIINDIDIHNSEQDPHSIVDYLSDATVARQINSALP